jgi:hypothetical protein
MQISPANLAHVSPLQSKPTGSASPGKGSLDELTAHRIDPTDPDPAPAGNAATDSVSISPQVRSHGASNAPAPVYAEIWKGAVKVAQIDIHGQVHSYSGLLASSGGGGIAGALRAAQRAVQIAQQVGGEIRTTGQAIDSQTLLMRARLANSYQSSHVAR